MRKVKRAFFYVVLFLCKILPLKRRCVLFSSFTKSYNDNPKYISKKLYEISPNSKQVWVVKNGFNTKNLPSYITWVKENSVKHAYYMSRAKVLVDGYVGMIYCSKENKINGFYKKIKRKKQVNFSTWHGTPLKKIGIDAIYNKNVNTYCSADAMLLNSNYIKEKMESAFGLKKAYLVGSPRNDVLFSADERQQEMKQKLGLPLDKKIVLYAPTFRDVLGGKSASVYMDEKAVKACKKALANKFGGEWAFVYRAHKKVLEDGGLLSFNSDEIIDGNKFDEMALYLVACDVLITDYSGSLFDFTITKRPCFLYAPDYIEYKDQRRGLYMELNELPYPYALTVEDLEVEILNYDHDLTIEKVQKFNDQIGMVDDGNASQRIAEMITKIK